ncbi:DinB family protein [Luedemannella helvata]|uniref:DinB family protein n=1 Tax=Luedemannella helvata TaxID=349315 RepID=A0ABP4VVP5_9ACTN
MSDLDVLFEHHLWATRTLIEHCQTLTPEQLQSSSPGTYGAIVPTLIHIVAEDQRLLQRLTGESAEVVVTEGDDLTLERLHEIWLGQSERWRAVLKARETLDVTLPARGPWPEVPGARPLVLLEAIQHSNDHRTHVNTVLSVNNLPFPYLCGWMFWRSTGRVTAGS